MDDHKIEYLQDEIQRVRALIIDRDELNRAAQKRLDSLQADLNVALAKKREFKLPEDIIILPDSYTTIVLFKEYEIRLTPSRVGHTARWHVAVLRNGDEVVCQTHTDDAHLTYNTAAKEVFDRYVIINP